MPPIQSVSANTAHNIQTTEQTRLMHWMPWLAGAGIAVGHVLTASNCSLPQQGKCTACGSCALALVALTTWALTKQRQGASKAFYE